MAMLRRWAWCLALPGFSFVFTVAKRQTLFIYHISFFIIVALIIPQSFKLLISLVVQMDIRLTCPMLHAISPIILQGWKTQLELQC